MALAPSVLKLLQSEDDFVDLVRARRTRFFIQHGFAAFQNYAEGIAAPSSPLTSVWSVAAEVIIARPLDLLGVMPAAKRLFRVPAEEEQPAFSMLDLKTRRTGTIGLPPPHVVPSGFTPPPLALRLVEDADAAHTLVQLQRDQWTTLPPSAPTQPYSYQRPFPIPTEEETPFGLVQALRSGYTPYQVPPQPLVGTGILPRIQIADQNEEENFYNLVQLWRQRFLPIGRTNLAIYSNAAEVIATNTIPLAAMYSMGVEVIIINAGQPGGPWFRPNVLPAEEEQPSLSPLYLARRSWSTVGGNGSQTQLFIIT